MGGGERWKERGWGSELLISFELFLDSPINTFFLGIGHPLAYLVVALTNLSLRYSLSHMHPICVGL